MSLVGSHIIWEGAINSDEGSAIVHCLEKWIFRMFLKQKAMQLLGKHLGKIFIE